MSAQAEELSARNLVGALDHLHQERVELWTAALTCFVNPAPAWPGSAREAPSGAGKNDRDPQYIVWATERRGGVELTAPSAEKRAFADPAG